MHGTDYKNLIELREHVNMLVSVHPSVTGSVALDKVMEVIDDANA